MSEALALKKEASEFDVETLDLDHLNEVLEFKTAQERLEWAIGQLKPYIILSSSFGAQAAVCLHLCVKIWPEIPVVVTDTGYLFPETYQFIDELTQSLKLNLKVHPIVDWNDKKVFDYMFEQDLPYHPLWEQGYISIGDTHTSHRLVDGVTEEEVRFFGLKRECGLHEDFDSGKK